MFYTRDFLNSVTEECREYDGCPDNEEAGSYQREDMLGDSVFARVHLDVYLECGYDRKTSCNRINDILDVQHVLYFTCNYTDNQYYVKSEKGKCSQNDTRIVLPLSVEKGCVQLPQNRVKLPIEAHYSTKHILTV